MSSVVQDGLTVINQRRKNPDCVSASLEKGDEVSSYLASSSLWPANRKLLSCSATWLMCWSAVPLLRLLMAERALRLDCAWEAPPHRKCLKCCMWGKWRVSQLVSQSVTLTHHLSISKVTQKMGQYGPDCTWGLGSGEIRNRKCSRVQQAKYLPSHLPHPDCHRKRTR